VFVVFLKAIPVILRSKLGRRLALTLALAAFRLVRRPEARAAYAFAWGHARSLRPRRVANRTVAASFRRARTRRRRRFR
jgi:hypothetical protein